MELKKSTRGVRDHFQEAREVRTISDRARGVRHVSEISNRRLRSNVCESKWSARYVPRKPVNCQRYQKKGARQVRDIFEEARGVHYVSEEKTSTRSAGYFLEKIRYMREHAGCVMYLK